MTRLAWIIAGAALLAGCQSLTDGSDIEVTVDVLPSNLRPGLDTVLIAVAAHNRGAREITLSGSRGCMLRYEVWDVSGQRARGPGSCDDVLWTARIAPNDSLVSTFAWSGQGQDWVWDVVESKWRPKLLESGAYRAVGVLNANELQQRSGFVEIELIEQQS